MRNYRYVAWIIPFIILHIFLVAQYISFEDYFNDRFIVNDDYPLHEYRYTVIASEKKLWVYDPYFMAGYPLGAVEYGSKLLEIIFLLLDFSKPILIYKIFILFVYFLSPILFFYYVCFLENICKGKKYVNLKEKYTILLVSGLLLLFYWHLNVTLDGIFLISFFSYGGILFIFSIFLSPLVVIRFYKVVTNIEKSRYSEIKDVVIFFIILEVTFLTHFESLFLFISPILFLVYQKKLYKNSFFLKQMVLLALLFLVLNSSWMIDFLKMFNYRSSSNQYFQIDYPFSFFFSSPLNFIISVGFLISFLKWNRLNELKKAFGIGILFLLSLSSIPFFLTSHLQPLRFYMPGIIYAIPIVSEILVKRLKKSVHILSLLFFIFLLSTAYFIDVSKIQKEFSITESLSLKLTTNIPEDANKLIKFILENTTRDRRILIEDAGLKKLGYGGHKFAGHFLSLFPIFTKREYIGGPHPAFPLRHHKIEFTNGYLFGKFIGDYNTSELRKIFKLYNIGWIIVYNDTSKKILEKIPSVKSLEKIGAYTVFEVVGNYSWFIEGSGKVYSTYGKLYLVNVTSEKKYIILKYHCSPTMKLHIKAFVTCEKIEPDPIGFIRIDFNNYLPNNFTIVLS